MSETTGWNPMRMRVALAKDLRQIEELTLEMHDQALNSPNARDFPGGTALHMTAPAIPLQDWEEEFDRKEAEAWSDPKFSGWSAKTNPAIDQGDDDEQPVNVLSTWTRKIREERGQSTGLKPTVSREVDYLRKQLDWIVEIDEIGGPAWPLCQQLADELSSLVRRMEIVVRNHPQVDRGVGCLKCGSELLKIWGIDPGTDRYVCTSPECGKRYDIEEYHQAVERSYLLNAEWLTAGQAAAVYRVPMGTILSWANRGHVRKRRHTEFKRIVYCVADIVTRRDIEADSHRAEGVQ
jgi:hypothetical protein